MSSKRRRGGSSSLAIANLNLLGGPLIYIMRKRRRPAWPSALVGAYERRTREDDFACFFVVSDRLEPYNPTTCFGQQCFSRGWLFSLCTLGLCVHRLTIIYTAVAARRPQY